MSLAFFLATSLSFLLTPVVARLHSSKTWRSPNVNRVGKHPSLSGGVTIGLLVFLLAILLEGPGQIGHLKAFWLGLLLISTMGLLDDLVGLGPLSKLLLQCVCVAATLGVMAYEGRLESGPAWFGLLLLWVVGVANAFNLLDNMDGLAGGVGCICAFVMAVLFFPAARAEPTILVLLAGALLGFLPHNFSPAAVYLGDSGSHLTGFTLATLPLYSESVTGGGWRCAAVLVLVLAVPIADTSFVVLRRTLSGRPVYVGGKDHSSHWLLSRGLSERQVALVFYALAVGSSMIAVLIAGSAA